MPPPATLHPFSSRLGTNWTNGSARIARTESDKGDAGAQGIQGIQGEKGEKGEKGGALEMPVYLLLHASPLPAAAAATKVP